MLRMLLRHLGVFLWVSLATHLHEPPNYNSLSNNLSSSRWQIHTHIHTTTQNNQILGCLESRVLDLQLSLYLPFHMIFKFIAPQQQTTTTSSWMWLCGPMRKSSKYSWCTSLLTYTKDQNFVHHNFVKVVGYPPPIPSPLQTKQNNGCVTHSLALPFYIKKSILRQKKTYYYENSNISPCKNIIFPKILVKKNIQNIVQDIIITL